VRFRVNVVVLACLCLLQIAQAARAGGAHAQKVRMEEVSLLKEAVGGFALGAFPEDLGAPEPSVRYPALKSSLPFHGVLRAGGDRLESDTAATYYFVVDESGKRGYDLLYVDLNRDNDLTNDKPVHVMAEPPQTSLFKDVSIKSQVFFNPITLRCPRQNGRQAKVEVVPRFVRFNNGSNQVFFLTTKVYRAGVEVEGQKLEIVAGRQYFLAGGLDEAAAHLVIQFEKGSSLEWWGADSPRAYHRFGGGYYQFLPAWNGKYLRVAPYEGELGTLEVTAGGRAGIEEVAIWGSMRSESSNVAAGGAIKDGWPTGARSCRVPVGDYCPYLMTVTMDRLSFSFSENYHAEGKPRGGIGTRSYPIHIRADKPFVLDFSGKPEIIFPSPAAGTRVRRGESLQASAVLVDPALGIMIRNMTIDEKRYEGPKVTITRAGGEQVAEGVMPFG